MGIASYSGWGWKCGGSSLNSIDEPYFVCAEDCAKHILLVYFIFPFILNEEILLFSRFYRGKN